VYRIIVLGGNMVVDVQRFHGSLVEEKGPTIERGTAATRKRVRKSAGGGGGRGLPGEIIRVLSSGCVELTTDEKLGQYPSLLYPFAWGRGEGGDRWERICRNEVGAVKNATCSG